MGITQYYDTNLSLVVVPLWQVSEHADQAPQSLHTPFTCPCVAETSTVGLKDISVFKEKRYYKSYVSNRSHFVENNIHI